METDKKIEYSWYETTTKYGLIGLIIFSFIVLLISFCIEWSNLTISESITSIVKLETILYNFNNTYSVFSVFGLFISSFYVFKKYMFNKESIEVSKRQEILTIDSNELTETNNKLLQKKEEEIARAEIKENFKSALTTQPHSDFENYYWKEYIESINDICKDLSIYNFEEITNENILDFNKPLLDTFLRKEHIARRDKQNIPYPYSGYWFQNGLFASLFLNILYDFTLRTFGHRILNRNNLRSDVYSYLMEQLKDKIEPLYYYDKKTKKINIKLTNKLSYFETNNLQIEINNI